MSKAKECFSEALTLHASHHTYQQLAKVLRSLTYRSSIILTAQFQVYLQEGDLPAVLDTYATAIGAFPENTDLLTAAGLVHLQLGNTSKAFELFGNALTYNARDPQVLQSPPRYSNPLKTRILLFSRYIIYPV